MGRLDKMDYFFFAAVLLAEKSPWTSDTEEQRDVPSPHYAPVRFLYPLL